MSTVTGPAARFETATVDLPGMEVALRLLPDGQDGGALRHVRRRGRNDWVLALGRPRAALPGDEGGMDPATGPPGGVAAVLEALNGRFAAGRGDVRVALARLELDRCGAWMTIGCAGHPLPILVRAAGWIDVRGQAGPALGRRPDVRYAEDRVGLGPGDALVFTTESLTGARDSRGEAFSQEGLAETLLSGAGQRAATLADRLLDAAAAHAGGALPDDTAVLVVRVPADAGDDPDARLQSALGDADAGEVLPGYPVAQPAWSPDARPSPPREARILLAPAPASVPAGRRFATTVLHSWRMSELVEEGDVELITSELLGNAVRHDGHDITVLLRYDGRRLRVAVGDGSRALPRPRQAGEGDVDGRGLVIVEALAAAVGVSPTVGGKRVWAEVEVPEPATPAPRR